MGWFTPIGWRATVSTISLRLAVFSWPKRHWSVPFATQLWTAPPIAPHTFTAPLYGVISPQCNTVPTTDQHPAERLLQAQKWTVFRYFCEENLIFRFGKCGSVIVFSHTINGRTAEALPLLASLYTLHHIAHHIPQASKWRKAAFTAKY